MITARLGLVKETRNGNGTTDYATSSQGQSRPGQLRFGQGTPTFNIYTNVTTSTRTDYRGEIEVEAMEEDKKAEKVLSA